MESIRGVNVDGVVRKLTDLGLIKIGGRKDVVGKPFLYITTRKFLEYFGINTIKDLPKLEEFAALTGTNDLRSGSQDTFVETDDTQDKLESVISKDQNQEFESEKETEIADEQIFKDTHKTSDVGSTNIGTIDILTNLNNNGQINEEIGK